MQLYHNADASDVASLSTHSDGTKGQPQRQGEGNCESRNADISFESIPVVELGLYTAIHLWIHLRTHTNIQGVRRQGWEGMGPLLWYNLSWSSHDSPLFTIPGNVAALQEQEFAFREMLAAFCSDMGQWLDITHDQMNHWRWDNPRAFRDQDDCCNL